MEQNQKQLFLKADRLFANGPLLRDALKSITRRDDCRLSQSERPMTASASAYRSSARLTSVMGSSEFERIDRSYLVDVR